MNVVVIGKSSRIVSIIQHIKGITDTRFSMDGTNVGVCDYILLDHVTSKELDSLLHDYPDKPIAYIADVRNGLRSDHGMVKELCAVKGIPFLTNHSDESVQGEVEKLLFPQRYEGKLQPAISLISCHRKSGACTIADALGEGISEKTSAHICLVKLDPYNVTSSAQGFNLLYREFDASGLTTARIKEVAERKNDNLYYISGNPKMDHARGFHPNNLEQIYNLIQATFDLTIFIVYPYWDNSMTLVSMKNINRKYLVATSKKEEMREFYAFIPQIRYQFDLDLRQHSFIYNFEGFGSESKISVSDHLQAGCVLHLPYVPGPNPMSKKYTRNGIQRLAETILNEYRLPVVNESKSKSWFSKLAIGG